METNRLRIVRWAAVLAVVTLPLLRAPAAQAQDLLEEPRARQGYWVGLGLVGNAARIVEKGDSLGIYSGSGLTLRLGEMITRRIGLGLSVDYAGIKKNQDKGAVGGLAIECNVNVWRNLAVHTGAGFGFVMLTDDATKDKDLRGGAGSYGLLGVSYDFFPWRDPNRLSGGWAITPTLNFRAMPDGNIHSYTLFAGVQVIRWSGLERNKLKVNE